MTCQRIAGSPARSQSISDSSLAIPIKDDNPVCDDELAPRSGNRCPHSSPRRVGACPRAARYGRRPPPAPQVSRTSIGVDCCGVSYPIWNTGRDRAFDFSELRELGVKFVRLDYVYDKANWQAEAERVSSLASSDDIATTLIVGGWMRYDDRPSPTEFETFARETAGKSSRRWMSSRSRTSLTSSVGPPGDLRSLPTGRVRGRQGCSARSGCLVRRDPRFGCAASPCLAGTAWSTGRRPDGGKSVLRGTFDALPSTFTTTRSNGEPENAWDWAFVDPANVRGVMDSNGDTSVLLGILRGTAYLPCAITLEEQAQIVGTQSGPSRTRRFPSPTQRITPSRMTTSRLRPG